MCEPYILAWLFRRTFFVANTSDQFFSSQRSGPNQMPSIFHGPSCLTEAAGKSAGVPWTHSQTHRHFAINFGSSHRFVPSDFFAHHNHLGTSRYKHADVVSVCHVTEAPGCVRPRMGESGQHGRIDRDKLKGFDLIPFPSTMTPGDA